jgi:adenine-specific DNA-methyltransferase
MPERTQRTRPSSLTRVQHKEVEALHRRCGIYTNPDVVRWILDAVGWHEKADLSRSRLLEPAAGNGAFVVEAARRLVAALLNRRIVPNLDSLLHRITAFELHPRECEAARSRVAATLRSAGIHHRTAEICARSWIVGGDFLLANRPTAYFTHTVGNPPYIRWPRIPQRLKATYEKRLPQDMTGGDLFLPFLDRALQLLRVGGSCGFLCSDRWRFMAFAERFRRKWLPRLAIKSERKLSSLEAFVDNVDSYPAILIGSKRALKEKTHKLRKVKRGKTLAELGCVVNVGPALGHTPAYVLALHEDDVEPGLLQPWIDGTEIAEGKLSWKGRRVVVMYGNDEKLVDLTRFPLLKARLTRFRKRLRDRAIVANGAPWFRPIDRVIAAKWSRPKLLVPELAKIPRLAIDRTGAIPSHGVYAIFAPDDDVDALYEKLRDGKLAAALAGIAPKVKGEYVRCYRRFLLMVRVKS